MASPAGSPAFAHRFLPGGSKRTLLLLHGTGGNEGSLIPLARSLDPNASILSVRGRVLEDGMPRFFRRFAEGIFDAEDIRLRAGELADFLAGAASQYGFEPGSLVALGYSNGANMAGALLLLRPEVLEGAAMLRPMLTIRPEKLPNLRGKEVLILAGTADPIVPKVSTLELEAQMKSCGARVTTRWADSGHSLAEDELAEAQAWLAGFAAGGGT